MEVSGTSSPGPFNPGNDPPVPLNRRLGGPQGRYKCVGEEKNLSPCRDQKPNGPARSLAIIPTPIPQLLHGHVKM